MLVVNCDEYIIENKQEFLQFIAQCAEKEIKLFPMVFFNTEFIGGYAEAETHYKKINAFSGDCEF
jgi:hypothetical protein